MLGFEHQAFESEFYNFAASMFTLDENMSLRVTLDHHDRDFSIIP